MCDLNVIYIGSIVVETESLLIASKVASEIANSNAVRGTVPIDGKEYRWSTIQQYEYHEGLTKST